MLETRTITVGVRRAAAEVYDFAADPANLPKWAGGLGAGVERSGDGWIVQSPQGPARLRFAPRNAFGVLDHYVSPAPGVEVYVAMRVVANGEGSEVIFTLFRQREMSDAQFAEDAALVRRDLDALRDLLEA